MIPPLHTHSLVPDILAWGLLLLAHKGVIYTMRGFGVAKRILANLSNQSIYSWTTWCIYIAFMITYGILP